ncbi:MAG: hypothetical protein ACI4Q3_07695 [Kiritimatiellia bacterium]
MKAGRFLGVLLLVLAAGLSVHADSAHAVLRLLNSRASGSVRGYAEAAAEVAEEARRGRTVCEFLIAVISRDPDAPAAAKLDDQTRARYLERSRAPIRRLAEENNNAMALYLLSLEAGDTNLLRRAADAGSVQAENAWGSCIFSQAMVQARTTNEVETALGRAFGYFKRAAGEGDANGLYNMGMCHWRGLGVPKNERHAFDCFRAAAEKGHPEAINNIGAFFRDGIVVEKDVELATKWFAKSASYENAFGQFNYALALRRAEGCARDLKTAAGLLKKAADGGCVEAINVYGVALWKGEGTEPDPAAAFGLFLKAAGTGYPPAMENVSTCYEKGVGVKADERKALEWKIRSKAAQGDRNAQVWLLQNGLR